MWTTCSAASDAGTRFAPRTRVGSSSSRRSHARMAETPTSRAFRQAARTSGSSFPSAAPADERVALVPALHCPLVDESDAADVVLVVEDARLEVRPLLREQRSLGRD